MKKEKLKLGIILTVILTNYLIVLTSCFASNPEQDPKYYNAETELHKIVVHGYRTNGHIKNIGQETIMVKYISYEYDAKRTRWTENFPPGYIKVMDIPTNSRFHLYNKSGGYIGFIRPTPNGRKGR